MGTKLIPGRKPVVLLDMDGPFAHWDIGLNRLLVAVDPKFPIIEPNDWYEYYGYRNHAPHHYELVVKTMSTAGLYENLIAVEGSHEALEFAAAHAEVMFCSKPDPANPTCESDKKNWLARTYDPYWASRLILTPDKTMVFGDILVDDHPSITGLCAPAWTQFVFDKTYNRSADAEYRVSSDWANFPELMDRAGLL